MVKNYLLPGRQLVHFGQNVKKFTSQSTNMNLSMSENDQK